MKITSLNRNEHRALSAAIVAALKQVADDFGVDISTAGGTLGGASGVVRLNVTLRQVAGGVSGAEAEYKQYAAFLRMPNDGYGKTVRIGREVFKIVGLNPAAPKNCVELERIHDKKRFKCPRESVIAQLTAAKAA